MDKKKEKRAQTSLKIHYWHPLHGIQLFGNSFILNTYHWVLFWLKHSVLLKKIFFKFQFIEYGSTNAFMKSWMVSYLQPVHWKPFVPETKWNKHKNPKETKSKEGKKQSSTFIADSALLFWGWSHAAPWSVRSYQIKDKTQASDIQKNSTFKDFRYHLKSSGCPWLETMICSI